jgi:hypothetical protein
MAPNIAYLRKAQLIRVELRMRVRELLTETVPWPRAGLRLPVFACHCQPWRESLRNHRQDDDISMKITNRLAGVAWATGRPCPLSIMLARLRQSARRRALAGATRLR